MNSVSRYSCLTGLVVLLTAGNAPSLSAQTLFLNPPRESIRTGETFTFDLAVDGGIENAVAWGTQIALEPRDINGTPVQFLEFVTNFDGANRPFRSTNPFFDTALQYRYVGGNRPSLQLYYLNLTPDAVLGEPGYVTLGQFQVRMRQDPGIELPGITISMTPLGTPPYGTAVQDAQGNNLLFAVEGSALTSVPPNPEPAFWLFPIAAGLSVIASGLRRKGRH